MKTVVTFIPYDCLALEAAVSAEYDLPEQPSAAQLNRIMEEYLGDAYFERVRVFWNGEYTDMFVDEDGIAGGLPVNPVATMIYRNNVAVHDPMKLLGAPSIHGPAVLFSRRVYF